MGISTITQHVVQRDGVVCCEKHPESHLKSPITSFYNISNTYTASVLKRSFTEYLGCFMLKPTEFLVYATAELGASGMGEVKNGN